MSKSANPWVQTYTGKAFDLVEPTVEMVSWIDLAYGLSRQVRFNGHALNSISIAQHSVLVALAAAQHHKKGLFPSNISLHVAVAWALLHDAAETYIGDVASPVRRAMRKDLSKDHSEGMLSAFDEIDDKVSQTIWTWAGLRDSLVEWNVEGKHVWSPLAWREIKQIDYRMLAFEKKWFVRVEEPQPWNALPPAFVFSDFGLDADDPEDFAVARSLVSSWPEKEAVDTFKSAMFYLGRNATLFKNIRTIEEREMFWVSPVQKRFARLMEIYS